MISSVETYSLEFITSQLLAALAFLAGIRGFLSSAHKELLINFAICSFLSASHFALLGAWTACVVVMVSGARHLVAIFNKKTATLYFFLLLVVFSTYFTYQHPVNILAAFSAFLGTLGSFSHDIIRARRIWMVSSTTYIIHNVLVHSPVAVIMESVFLVCNIIAYKRRK